jgi:pyruvate/2-oxoglutarate dehydrogenase complex dihydrolipoamide dehydrogenase (E3) component
MNEIKADICVIGAGSGGLTVAAGASQMGAKTVLIEKGKMGGDCLNYGCIPSKALLAAAKQAYGMGQGEKFGIAPAIAQVDYAKTQAHVAGVIAAIEPHDSVERFEGLGVTVLKGTAQFTGPRTVEVEGTRVTAKRIVVATGSSPLVPPIEGLSEVPYLTNETIFDSKSLPGHLIIIGGGAIGVEMAQAHRRLGAQVTVLEAANILHHEDPDLVSVVRDQLVSEGVDVHETAMVTGAQVSASGGITVTASTPSGDHTFDGSHVLVAVGRRPNVSGLNLEAAGITYTPRGIEVDARLRTSNKKIFAIGDVSGRLQFTHVAGYEGGIVIRNALFKLPAKASHKNVPWVTYTDPELAHIGLTEAQAREQFGGKVRVLTAPFEGNDRAVAERDTRGFLKVMVSSKGEILGASIVGAGAGEVIQQWSLAMSAGLKVGAMASFIAPYPTRGEISKRAVGEYYTPTLYSSKTRFLVKLLSKLG